ncbi:MAG: hypothetical protein JSV66_11370 [Trueperaceae bacterium]|nr:MAG: hypothetical protein JSV66_11370 [Trueperaceae bacterium]
MKTRLLVSVFFALVILGGCRLIVKPETTPASVDTATTMPQTVEVTFTRIADTLSGPEMLEGGYTTVTFTNSADQPYELTLVRLREGVTPEEFELLATAAEDGTGESLGALLEVAEIYGGVAAIPPGASASAAVTLAEGRYLAFSSNYEGGVEARFDFDVSGSNGAQAPVADREITMFEFGFGIDAEIPAGKELWRISNIGEQLHHVMIFPVEPGTTIEDVNAALSQPGEPAFVTGPPVVTSATFTGGISNDLTVELAPGSYGVICFVPDIETGLPHAALGMVSLVTVPGS